MVKKEDQQSSLTVAKRGKTRSQLSSHRGQPGADYHYKGEAKNNGHHTFGCHQTLIKDSPRLLVRRGVQISPCVSPLSPPKRKTEDFFIAFKNIDFFLLIFLHHLFLLFVFRCVVHL